MTALLNKKALLNKTRLYSWWCLWQCPWSYQSSLVSLLMFHWCFISVLIGVFIVYICVSIGVSMMIQSCSITSSMMFSLFFLVFMNSVWLHDWQSCSDARDATASKIFTLLVTQFVSVEVVWKSTNYKATLEWYKQRH